MLGDIQQGIDLLSESNRPEAIRTALAQARFKSHYLIRGSRGTCVNDLRSWSEVLDLLRIYRHQVRACVRALNRMGEPTPAQKLSRM